MLMVEEHAVLVVKLVMVNDYVSQKKGFLFVKLSL